MKMILMASVLCLVGTAAEAGPFGRYRSATTTCTSGSCGTSTSRTVVRGSTSTAAGVAAIQAGERRMAHHGGNYAYEGVGVGSTPEAALANCCTNGRPVVDQGVAQGSDGRWYACKRYAR